jgi:mRNA interferase RelE/StbE
MKGVRFLFDEHGDRKAVLIDLRKNKALWEDFYDSVLRASAPPSERIRCTRSRSASSSVVACATRSSSRARARRELERLPPQIARRALRRLESLAIDPRPRGARKLHGAADLFRIRSGDYRIVYRVDDDHGVVDVIAIRHRADAYR